MEQFDRRYGEDIAPVMSVGKWIGTYLLLMIPLVNLIFVLIWAFSSEENPNRKNWAIAMIIIWVVVIALYAILFLIFGQSMLRLMSGWN
jgi:Trk-type K+ transport system membrane component